MFTKAFKHLKKDPVMNFLIKKYHDQDISR